MKLTRYITDSLIKDSVLLNLDIHFIYFKIVYEKHGPNALNPRFRMVINNVSDGDLCEQNPFKTNY